MIEKPRLKKFLTLYPIDDKTWGIRGGGGESWSIKLHQENVIRCFGALLPFLNGTRDREEILQEVAAMGLDREVADKLLTRLENASLIEDVDPAGLAPQQQERFASQINLFSAFTNEGGAKYQAALLDSRVGVVGSGSLAQSLCRSFEAAGFGRVSFLPTEEGAPGAASSATEVLALDRQSILAPSDMEPLPDVMVVAQTAHDPELLEAMHVFSVKHNVPWLLVRAIDQTEGWVGPLFVPRDTASYVSFEARLRGNMTGYDEYVNFNRYLRTPGGKASDVGGLHAFHDVMAGLATTELIKLITGIAVPVLASKFISVNLWTLETEIHEVLRFPRIEDEAYSRPSVFPWKELPYDGVETRRA